MPGEVAIASPRFGSVSGSLIWRLREQRHNNAYPISMRYPPTAHDGLFRRMSRNGVGEIL